MIASDGACETPRAKRQNKGLEAPKSSGPSACGLLVEEAPEGGYTAHALGESMFAQADDMPKLREMVRDAVRCHFPDESSRPKMIRLHFVSDEVIAA
jgi:hypothetical protein